MQSYQISQREISGYISILGIDRFIENSEESLQLNSVLTPFIMEECLKNLGYEREYMESNGWQWDYWIKMIKPNCQSLMISGEGYNFTLCLSKVEDL